MKSSIPNLFTASNLFCGILALIFIMQGNLTMALIMIFCSLLMDFLDGFVARALRVSSPVGKELDSLADMVTFGVVPGFVMARMIQEAQGLEVFPNAFFEQGFPFFLIAFLIPVFSAVRLARFNLDERQSDAFFGVPTPANTILICACWMIVNWSSEHWLAVAINRLEVLIPLCLLSCYLLIADIRLIALKFKNFRFADNQFRFILIFSTLIGLALFQHLAVPFLFGLYLLLSIIENQMAKKAS